jgi:hypothetical protein
LNNPTHLSLTEKPVPETVTNGDDDLGDVRVDRAKTGERSEKSQRARAASRGEGYMPVPVGDQISPVEQRQESFAFKEGKGPAARRARTQESKKP